MSESTVRTHLKNIRQKLGSINYLQIMIYACQHNLISDNHKPICPNCRFSVNTF
ncbi:helix-turn-helix transcriptional regulator [Draconibacterium orientale]|uniref:helix-turn-helix transcriptional regulator n=1 Tax=Draconibacterium orientale TaxID=1168034 RepID=UPI0009DFD891